MCRASADKEDPTLSLCSPDQVYTDTCAHMCVYCMCVCRAGAGEEAWAQEQEPRVSTGAAGVGAGVHGGDVPAAAAQPAQRSAAGTRHHCAVQHRAH